jgi:hypothetical protein
MTADPSHDWLTASPSPAGALMARPRHLTAPCRRCNPARTVGLGSTRPGSLWQVDHGVQLLRSQAPTGGSPRVVQPV